MPKPPPPASAELPDKLRIEVTIDGEPAPPLDAARLGELEPDFQDEERRAWKMATLLGPAATRPGAVVAVTGQLGLTILMRPSATAGEPLAVLAVTRRGDAVAAVVSPSEPFPTYHGRGGRLNRPGDPLPRMSGVTRISVYLEADAGAAAAARPAGE